MKKKIVIICLLAFLSISVGAYSYWNNRKQLNLQLSEILDSIDIKQNAYLYSEEFISKVEDIVYNYKLRSNSQIKRLIEDLSYELSSGVSLVGDQISEQEIQAQIESILDSTVDYGTGKLFIYTDQNYRKYLHKDKGYVECSVYAYSLTNEPIVDLDAKIKIRGNSTATAPKKPYNIKFSEKVDLYGFGDAKKWSLLAEYFDPTMLRNNLFLGFAKEMGLEYTSNCNYVEVWVDGCYGGVYLLTESVETGKNRVNIDVEEGDFLFEYEAEREEDDVTYINTEHGLRFAMSDPEEFDEDSLKYVQQKIDEFDKTIFSNNYNKICDLLDIESFAKLFVVNEYAKTVDFGYSSVNFYYKEGKFFAGPVWDFDLSSGNAAQIEEYDGYWNYEINDDYKDLNGISYEGLEDWNGNNKVFAKLYEYDGFKNEVMKTFNEYSSYMQRMYADGGVIDQLLNNYGDLILNNYAPIANGGAGWEFGVELNLLPFDNYSTNVDYLKYWLNNRFTYLNKVFNNK